MVLLRDYEPSDGPFWSSSHQSQTIIPEKLTAGGRRQPAAVHCETLPATSLGRDWTLISASHQIKLSLQLQDSRISRTRSAWKLKLSLTADLQNNMLKRTWSVMANCKDNYQMVNEWIFSRTIHQPQINSWQFDELKIKFVKCLLSSALALMSGSRRPWQCHHWSVLCPPRLDKLFLISIATTFGIRHHNLKTFEKT